MNLESRAITLNKCLVIGQKSSYKMKVCVVSHFEPLGLRCEMTVMPLDQVSGHDRVVSELYIYNLNDNLFKFVYGDS